MELPDILLQDVNREGNLYFFTKECPIGVPDHIHVCIRHHDRVLLFSTCTSQIDTVYKFACHGKDPNTYPCFRQDDVNKFSRPLTFVNCNNIVDCTVQEFGEYIKSGIVKPMDGIMTETDMAAIAKGVILSPWVSNGIKELFR